MSLDMLPPVVEMLKMPPSEQKRYIVGFKEHIDCNGFLFGIQKLINWCNYLRTVPDDHIDKLDALSRRTTVPPKVWTAIPNDSKGYFAWLADLAVRAKSPSLEESPITPQTYTPANPCYDDYYCVSPIMALVNFSLMGVLALVFILFALTANSMLIPAYNLTGIRSSGTIFMTGIAVCDSLALILLTLIVVVNNLHMDQASQLETYKSFSGYLIPFGQPIKELLELFSLWLVVGLLVDRYVQLRRGVRMTRLVNRSRLVRVLVILAAFFLLYTIPKFLKYKVIEVESKPGTGNYTGHVKVVLTQVAHSAFYMNLMATTRLGFEVIIPYASVFVLVLTLGSSLRQTDLTFTHRTHSKLLTQEKVEKRESINMLVAFHLGLLILFAKLPSVVYQFLSEYGRLDNALLGYTWTVVEVCDLLTLAVKPMIVLHRAGHVRRALRDMLCLYVRPGKTVEIALAGGLGFTVKISKSSSRSSTQDLLMTTSNSTVLPAANFVVHAGLPDAPEKAIQCTHSSSDSASTSSGEGSEDSRSCLMATDNVNPVLAGSRRSSSAVRGDDLKLDNPVIIV